MSKFLSFIDMRKGKLKETVIIEQAEQDKQDNENPNHPVHPVK
ncbi:MAG TPA: hypothetical protein PLN24_05305 [Victivallales bacterium]|nr:hypothetical protein [Victivallales bacterium]HRU02247.1 hypothetical protein [Victivallales bacterium]